MVVPNRGWSRRLSEGRDLAAEEVTEVLQSSATLLPASAPNRHEDCLSMRPIPGAVAAPDFAKDDAETHRLFRPPVGGVQPRLAEVREVSVDVLPKMFGQLFIGGVAFAREDGGRRR